MLRLAATGVDQVARPIGDVAQLVARSLGSDVAECYQQGEALLLALRAKLDQVHAALADQLEESDDLAPLLEEAEGRYRAHLRQLRVIAFLAVLHRVSQPGGTIGDALSILSVDRSLLPLDLADLTDEQLHYLRRRLAAASARR